MVVPTAGRPIGLGNGSSPEAAIVAAAGVLKGKQATTVGKCALDITQVGGKYVEKPLVVDGNLISCGTWHDYDTQFMKIFIRQLKDTAKE